MSKHPMLELKEITLDLKGPYNAIAGKEQYSFYRFANLYMAKDCTHLKYAEIDGSICILSIPPAGAADYPYYSLFPLGNGDLKKITQVLKEAFGTVNFFSLMPEKVEALEAACPGMFRFEEKRDDFDYIYETESLLNLQGKKYHSKRNFISRFTNNYEYEYITLDEENVRKCREVVEEWFTTHPGHTSPIFDERQAIRALMDNFDALDLRGGALRVNGSICAFSIGEMIEPDTAHIIIEKADTSYEGAYAVINRDFLQRAWAETTYVNREEDMGLPGLRRAKMSYRPVRFNEVYNAYLK